VAPFAIDPQMAPTEADGPDTGAIAVHSQAAPTDITAPAAAADTAATAAALASVATGLAAVSTAAAPVVAGPARPEGDGRGVATPAQQIGAGLQTLTRTVDGTRQTVLRLEPAELGKIQIAIAQPKDGAAAVVLTVERPETLLLVLRDQSGLHQALDRAGIAADGRTVSVELAPVRTEPQPAAAQAGHGQPDAFATNRDPGHGGRSARNQPGAAGDDNRTGPDTPGSPLSGAMPAWRRAGIDITA
jgi:flagellar hook-length control protein FliK